MDVTFSSKTSELTDTEREYAQKKLQRLTRYFGNAREAHVVHTTQRGFQIVEVQVDLDGTLLRAEDRNPDFQTAVDAVADKLDQQASRLKERVKDHKGRASAPTVALALDPTDENRGGDASSNP